jgi:hypothetical protein
MSIADDPDAIVTTSSPASPAPGHGRRWLYLSWQKLALPVYVLGVSREEARHCPHDILVGSTRWLDEAEMLRLARMELYPRCVGADAYLLPWHQRWRIAKLRRVYRRKDRPSASSAGTRQASRS